MRASSFLLVNIKHDIQTVIHQQVEVYIWQELNTLAATHKISILCSISIV